MSAGTIEVPVGIAELCGALKLNVLRDSEQEAIPLPLPINVMDTVGFNIDLASSVCTLQAERLPDGTARTAPMKILPSGHRCISIVELGPDGWEVPDDEDGDRFRLPTSGTSSKASLVWASAASSPLTAVWSVERTASSDIASWSMAPSTIRSTYSQPQEGSVSDGSLSSNAWSRQRHPI